MDKEFVTYEQALALKELGYDDTPWFDNQASLYDVDGEHTMYTNYGVMYSGINDGYIPAPLKQQVFRWFREKYNMLACVYSNASGFLFEYHDAIGGTHRYDSEITGPNDGGTWDTYEEAEAACIDKLIELAKQQDNRK
jgi:hypothetical protein